MPSTEVVFIGDLHLNSLDLLFPEYATPNDFIFETMKQPVQFARENNIKNLILLGDIFDGPEPDQASQNLFFKWLYEHSVFNIFIIPGNHDYEVANDGSYTGKFSLETAGFLTKLKLLPHVHLFTTVTEFSIDGVPFTFMPWPNHRRKRGKYPTVNIAHVPCVGAVSDSGRKFKKDEAYELNTSNGDFWIVGDLHRYQGYERCIYPGTLFQKTFGEPLPKGFLHADITAKRDKLIVKHKFHAIEPAFKLFNEKIETFADLKKLKPYSLNIRYKLFLKDPLPPKFLDENPHVVKWDKQSRLRVIEDLGKDIKLKNIDEVTTEELVYANLKPFLKNEGLGPIDRKRAISIVNNIEQRIKERQINVQ